MRNSKGLSKSFEHLPVIHLHHIAAAGNAQRFHCVRRHHAHLGVRGGRSTANRIRVELHELAKTPRAPLLVAIDVTRAVSTIRCWPMVKIFPDISRPRRRAVLPQPQSLVGTVPATAQALLWTS